MSFSPTLTQDSKTVPGVKFTVHRIGFGRRTDLDFKALAFRQRLRELEAENPTDTPREKELQEQIAIARKKATALGRAAQDNLLANRPNASEGELADTVDAAVGPVLQDELAPLLREMAGAADVETKKRRSVLMEEYSLMESRIRAVWIKDGLISIDGGEMDGMTTDQLLEYGPPDLALEIHDFIASGGKLSGEERKNSQSPITSDAGVGGTSQNTTASDAGTPPADSTSAATASAISPQP